MGKTTKRKLKKKKYTTRLEKNKKIYYKNNSVIDSHKNNNYKLVLIALVISLFVNAFFLVRVNNLSSSIDDLNNTLEDNKEDIKKLDKNYINYLFLGDSITDFYDLDKYYEGLPVVNSGISGNTTEDILNDMKNRVYNYNPSKVFLLIGINDLGKGASNEEVFSNIKNIITNIKKNKPAVKIYIESIYPINKNIDEDKIIKVKDNSSIIKINDLLKEYCKEEHYTYINMYDILVDEDGNFNEKYTDDGLHPNENGYEIITKELKKYLD